MTRDLFASMLRRIARTIPIAFMMVAANWASGQNYPSKPIRIVTTVSGGGNDLVARLIAPRLADALGQQVIVDRREGAAFKLRCGSRRQLAGGIFGHHEIRHGEDRQIDQRCRYHPPIGLRRVVLQAGAVPGQPSGNVSSTAAQRHQAVPLGNLVLAAAMEKAASTDPAKSLP